MSRPTAKNAHQRVTRGLVIRMAHSSQQRNSVVWPHHDGLAQAGSEEVYRQTDILAVGMSQTCHERISWPNPSSVDATARMRSQVRATIRLAGWIKCQHR